MTWRLAGNYVITQLPKCGPAFVAPADNLHRLCIGSDHDSDV